MKTAKGGHEKLIGCFKRLFSNRKIVQTIKKRIMASPPPETITPNPYLLLPQTLFTTSSCVVPCSSNFRFNAGKIGRASCRESEWIAVVAVALRLEDSDRRERCIGSE